jgi:Zn-dependent protease
MDIFYTISIWLLPVLIAVTFHEAAHGYVARFLGDETSKLGRVSLNPLRHIDPFGTIGTLASGTITISVWIYQASAG